MSLTTDKIGWKSATSLVLANMIGTGAFTTLGIQLELISNAWALLGLWLLGGVMALFGAFSYAELGVRMPKSGGEAYFLGEIFHPFLGFISGWVSLSVGFAAAIALSAIAVGAYLQDWTGWPVVLTASVAIVTLSLAHSISVRHSSRLQNILTAAKLLLVLGLAIAGICLPSEVGISSNDWSFSGLGQACSPAGAVALISVFYAYSGWNAAAYIVEEIEAPAKHLPKALIAGSLLVTGLFVALQYAFLRQAGTAALTGQIEVGQIAAEAMFGPLAGTVISSMIGVLLLAGISAMIWVGPRVVSAMGRQHSIWRHFDRRTKSGIPLRAIWLQSTISLVLVWTSSFERVLIYSGFVLQLFSFLAVLGLLLIRSKPDRKPADWQSPFYPFAQLFFLLFSGWSMGYLLINHPLESGLGLLNVLAGALAYRMNDA